MRFMSVYVYHSFEDEELDNTMEKLRMLLLEQKFIERVASELNHNRG